MKNPFIYLSRKTLLAIIKFYQKTFSPDHGILAYRHPEGYCRFYPTCSQYSYEAIEKFGILKGSLKATKRVIKCNPFSRGGYDPVDLNKKPTKQTK